LIAEVIVNHKSKKVDKPFDYAVPVGMDVRIGSCVIIPFGAGNIHKEGYVVAVKDSTDAKRLKSIVRISKAIILFNEKQLELIKWIREKYLVTYLDAIHLVAPSGTGVKEEQWLRVIDHKEPRSKKSQEILKRICDNGNEIEINFLMSLFDTDIKSQVKDLIKKGILEVFYQDARQVKDKVIRMAKLSDEDADLSVVIEDLFRRRAVVQGRMLELLSECNKLSLADLVNFSGGNYQAVKALEAKGFIEIFDQVVYREVSHNREMMQKNPDTIVLTDQQESVLRELSKGIDTNVFQQYLLFGVTGSGKTEVYIRTIKKALENGKNSIMLVPEISLTPQLVSRFSARFGDDIAIIHSGLSLSEKYDQWKKIREGQARIVIGARSAIFAPLENVGVIIMDEEHEQSYKSEMTPRYTTHEVAEYLARQHNAILLFASATPSISTYYKVEKGDLKLLELTKRYNDMPAPGVKIVDMRKELEDGNKSVLSRALKEEISKNLENKEQTILFLNRRGFSTFVSCRECGFVAECPNCSISLTYHKNDNTLKCHYCGHTVKNYTLCPSCGSRYIRYFGGGTQKVEDEIKKIFPNASTIRMDVDTTGKKNGHANILHRFESEKIDIMIGTQMVTKGLDFPNVTLVGVISADTILNIDDFRAGERTFSIIEQVSGRAGRAEKPGRSIIQTYSPENNAIKLAKEHNYIEFYKKEISARGALWYPPFCQITSVIFSSKNEFSAAKCARCFAKSMMPAKEILAKLQILGPIPAYVSRVKNHYIYRLTIKCENNDDLNEYLLYARDRCMEDDNYSNVTIVIDKNPNSMG